MDVREAGPARVEIDPERGGRIAGLAVAGLELLVAPRGAPVDPLAWGLYPMAPWAGRVRRGRFRFRGVEHTLPLRMPPHAIHGTVLDRPWRREGEGRYCIDLGPDWPWAGSARQEIELRPDALVLRLAVESAGEPFPASLGWHPWFRRRLARGAPAVLDFAARAMWRRDAEGIPTGERVPPPPGPWDDCFEGVRQPVGLRWPGALRLELASSAACWVVYDEPADALCVEPQTAPPDALEHGATRVEPGRPLEAEFTLRWWTE
jgi:galactose mutarotase-like enzyme